MSNETEKKSSIAKPAKKQTPKLESLQFEHDGIQLQIIAPFVNYKRKTYTAAEIHADEGLRAELAAQSLKGGEEALSSSTILKVVYE